MSCRVLVLLPDRDFDVTEVAVPWKLLVRAGHSVVFATSDGAPGAADPLLVSGVVLGQLGAKPEPLAFYRELERAPEFTSPLAWADVDPSLSSAPSSQLDALHLPGGHAKGMRPYLESERVQAIAAAFFAAGKPVSAICHGVLVLARAKDRATGRPLLHGRRTTCLPSYMERTAFYATAWRRGRYYRTYDAYVQQEVEQALGPDGSFERGPITLFAHGTDHDDGPAFVVEDGPYVSARWPGDAYLLAKRLLARLDASDRS
ncbi:MAG TPA: type 1 glutamine amidotransferase domain-containing protein [Nannocystaceae bacterium]|nr:type 1 glutamine amidotransferase domain-containing protein [Nannocystaceae bacterium]